MYLETSDRVLLAIARLSKLQRYPPTHREIAEAIGVTSQGLINYHLRHLIQRGVITMQRGKARSMVLTSEGKAYVKALQQQQGAAA